MQQQPLGNSKLKVTPLCFGTSGLGNMPDTYGYEVDETRARETLHAIFDSAVNFLDTGNNYGFGRSETRIGDALRDIGGLPEGFVLSTKVDRDMQTGRFDASRVRQSLEESLARLGIDSIPLLHLHDPEHARDLSEITAEGGALDELFRIKEEGIAETVGLAMGNVDVMLPILRERPFDAIISHNRYTLINRSANDMFDHATSRNIAILNAAPFAGGVLAKGSSVMPRITYQAADDTRLAPIRAIEAICADNDIAPGALALQFSLRSQRICSTIVGVSKPQRILETIAWANAKIPQSVWDQVEALGFETTDPEANRDYQPG